MILTALIVSANFNGQPTVMAIIPFQTRAECEAAMEPVYDGACGRVVGWVNDNEVADLDDWPVYIRADIHSAEIERLTANQVIRNRRSI